MITLAAATCLALNVYFEARDQDLDGQYLVAEVVMQRLASPNFPDTVCEVVYQPSAFSWTSDGKSDKPTDVPAWLQAQIVANDVLLNGCLLCIGATHFATPEARPDWAYAYQNLGLYGGHIFYAEPASRVTRPRPRPENLHVQP
jgi:spore germination cell wall hydrolase CwlJ-like protein